MASQDEVRTRILVLSDTHCALPDPIDPNAPFRWPLPKADVLLHAGDLTMKGTIDEHHKALELIWAVDAELKIIIPGNHDLSLDREWYHKNRSRGSSRAIYPDDTLDQIEAMYTGQDAVNDGIIYMVEGGREFTLRNGAKFTVYASAYQPEFFNWAFGYPRDQDRFNEFQECVDGPEWQATGAQNPVPPGGVDIMITHGPPLGIRDTTHRGDQVGCRHLRRAVGRCKPKLHVFGHIHESAGAVRKDWSSDSGGEEVIDPLAQADGKDCAAIDATDLRQEQETLFVNASIMNLVYTPLQPPWLIDVMLPSVSSGMAPV